MIYLLCIFSENLDFKTLVLSKNDIFCDHFVTNLVENFEIEACEILV